MEAASVVGGPIVERTVDSIFTIIGRHISYVSGHSENIEKLGRRLDALKIVHRAIKTKIRTANNNGDSVWVEVLDWSTKADQIEAETRDFLEGEVKNNDRCFKGLFPNTMSRYRRGKKTVEKTIAIAEHEEIGKRFEGGAVISDAAPTPDLRSRHKYSDYQGFESRKTVYDETMAALKDKTSHVIGVCGMGGVGKTTMVVEVGDRAKEDHIFYEVAMVVVSQDYAVIDIQKGLASQLSLALNDDGTQSTRADSLCKRLKNGKKILVILDDVWEELDLKGMGVPFEDGVMGCKILLTTRNRSLQANKWIDIEVLDPEEAWGLFREKMGSTISPDDMQEVAKKACEECGGLPIAINAIAAALKKNKSKERWDYILQLLITSKFENVPGVDKRARVCLGVSYQQLESEKAKSCFLFCSLFPEDFEITVDYLMRLGRGMGMVEEETALRMARSGTGCLVDELKDHCLLSEGKEKEHVKMHDLVRDLAISIASKDHQFLTGENLEQWPETQRKPYDRYRVISLTFDEDIPELPSGVECPKLHTIMLRCSRRKRSWVSLRNPDAVFNQMRKLQVIAMKHMKIASLPPSMSSLDDLRVLSLEYCDLGDVSLVGKLKKLEMLILQGSKIRVLPTEVGDLTRLKLLDLKGCSDLQIISPAVLQRLSKLQELFLPLSSGMRPRSAIIDEERSANLADELKALTQLVALEVNVPILEMLPPAACFPWDQLSHFKIGVQMFPTGGQYELRKNFMFLLGIPLAGGVKLLLKRVEVLYMHEMKDLKYFELQVGDSASFSHLEHLQATCCEGMQEFLAMVLERPIFLETPWRSMLRVLDVTNCNLQFLLSASAATSLVFLERLEIRDCENMEAVVGSGDAAAHRGRGRAGERAETVLFPRLEYLTLENLPKLVSFFHKTTMKQNEEFPQLFLEMPWSKLRALYVTGCNFQCLLSASAAKGLVSLEVLAIEDCGNIEVVVRSDDAAHRGRDEADTLMFPRLERLELRNLPKLTGVGGGRFDAFSALPNLMYIRLEELPKLENLPWEAAAATGGRRGSVLSPHLYTIQISRCGRLRNLFSSPNLSTLLIQNCEEMRNSKLGVDGEGSGACCKSSSA